MEAYSCDVSGMAVELELLSMNDLLISAAFERKESGYSPAAQKD